MGWSIFKNNGGRGGVGVVGERRNWGLYCGGNWVELPATSTRVTSTGKINNNLRGEGETMDVFLERSR